MDAPTQSQSPARMTPVRYSKYIAFLTRAFERVQSYYRALEEAQPTSEAESVAIYAQKFLATIQALALKTRYSPEYLRLPAVKLTGSGFPFYYDIQRLEADLATRDERLPSLSPIGEIKPVLLEHVMRGAGPEGEEKYVERLNSYLWQMSERAYLESLDLRQQFFQFTPGKLQPFRDDDQKGGRRSYAFSWGCYDTQSNRPCVYLMVLAQDLSEKPLNDPGNAEFLHMLDVIRDVAARAPENLKAIGVRLDESFPTTLYPKILKRVCFGPVVSPLLFEDAGPEGDATLASRLLPYFAQAGLADDEFALFFSTEYVLSVREEVVPKIFGKSKMRQIFSVPAYDRNLLRRGATAAANHCMLPHRLRQEISGGALSQIPELADAQLISYNQQGDVIDVG